MQRNVLTTDDLVFVGFNGKVFAVNLRTGDRVWRWQAPRGSRGVPMMLPLGEQLIVSINGYTWSLDMASGAEQWYQPFSGEGTGIAALASKSSSGYGTPAAAHAAAQAAAQAAAAAVVASSAAASAASS